MVKDMKTWNDFVNYALDCIMSQTDVSSLYRSYDFLLDKLEDVAGYLTPKIDGSIYRSLDEWLIVTCDLRKSLL